MNTLQSSAPATRENRPGGLGWLAVPALVFFVVFAVIPLFGVLYLSFNSWDGIGAIKFSGLDSWKAVVRDGGNLHALWVTFLITALSWAFQTPMSILIGTFLAGHQRYRFFLAVLYFIPLLLSSAAIAILFRALVDPNFGLGPGLKISVLTQDWLGRPSLALGLVVFIVSWQFIPFHSLIYQGGVRQIPQSLYEAAQLDGAGRAQVLRHVVLPALYPTMRLSVFFAIVGSLQLFDVVMPLTQGGPADSSQTMVTFLYSYGFTRMRVGFGSAIGVILFLICAVFAFTYQRWFLADE